MSECVVRMPYPKDCESCHLKTRNFFTGDFICAKTHTFLPASGKNNNCPIICSLPEGHGRLGDVDALTKRIEMQKAYIRMCTDCAMTERGKNIGNGSDKAFEISLLAINEIPTIVPAERSET